MIELIRNCSHASEVATYVETDEASKFVVKAASTQAGIAALHREREGWNWYRGMSRLSGEAVCIVAQEKDSYLKLRFPFIEGMKGDYNKGLEKNSELVNAVITHYCAIWGGCPELVVPIHGDLSLENVIFNGDGVHIIDWEHFDSQGGPWGFDALYLLYETLWFGTRGKRMPARKEMGILAKNITTLRTCHPLTPGLVDRPLGAIVDFFRTNRHVWGFPLSSLPGKFPVLRFSPSYVNVLDDFIGKALS